MVEGSREFTKLQSAFLSLGSWEEGGGNAREEFTDDKNGLNKENGGGGQRTQWEAAKSRTDFCTQVINPHTWQTSWTMEA